MEKTKKQKIAAVIVTYNRKDLLRECLSSLLNQNFSLASIIVIDNNSNDGTRNMISDEFDIKEIDYYQLSENSGGAGGFYEGIKKAYEKGFDWIWCMDDDAIPDKSALEELIKAKKFLENEGKEIGFLNSNVFDLKGNPMNSPHLDITKKSETNYPLWTKYSGKGILPINAGTFVSLLVSRKAIKELGLPIKEFFIWGDDIEYTHRISRKFEGYFIGKSKVIHKRKISRSIDILEENEKKRIKNHYYFYRNNSYTLKKFEKRRYFLFALPNWVIRKPLLALFTDKGIQKFKIILKGTLAGILFNPKIEYIN
ncbi:MAG: glycosyltransferase family 2 protein [Minisyncoccales bacterium]